MGLPYCHYYFFHFHPARTCSVSIDLLLFSCSVNNLQQKNFSNSHSTDVDCVPAGYGSPLVSMLLFNYKRILLATLRSWFGVFFLVTRGLRSRLCSLLTDSTDSGT